MMTKTCIHTKDIFNIKDTEKKMKYFNSCHKKALKCGLTCRCIIDQPFMELELWGSKWQFIKYYVNTLLKCQRKMDAIKRVMSIITT